MKISKMNGNDWVKIILAMSVLLVMVGITVSVLIHGTDYRYSDIGVTALAGVMGAIVGALSQGIKGFLEDDNKKDDSED